VANVLLRPLAMKRCSPFFVEAHEPFLMPRCGHGIGGVWAEGLLW
jgi:hypothetical protein